HGIADQSVEAGAFFSFTVAADTFRDIDAGDALAFSAGLFGGGALPSLLSSSPAARAFSGSAEAGARRGSGGGGPPPRRRGGADAGNDSFLDGAGDACIAGGAGADAIKAGAGRDILAFNRGDGRDTITGGGDGGNTLSLGGGIRYSDLSFSKAGTDLVVDTGADDRMVFKDWYAGSKSVLTLQLVLDATDEFDAGSSDPLRNHRVESFNFLGLVSAFDQARTQSPGLTSWALTNALLQFHLSGSDDAAIGG